MVEWEDSHYIPGWTTPQDDEGEPEPKRCMSVGWVRRLTKTAMVLVSHMTMHEGPHRCCEMTIPRRSILSYRRLSLATTTPRLTQI